LIFLAEAKPGSCQVRSRTESPCPRSAEVEILGVAFCGPCARQQEAYFAIGELSQQEDEAQGFRSKPLAEALQMMRRDRTGSAGLSLDADRVIFAQTRREKIRGLLPR
jgi:hypothetical protein